MKFFSLRRLLVSARCAILPGLAGLLAASGALAQDSIVSIELEGGIGVATSEYIIKGIDHANETGASLVVLETDTPGGLVSATRDIIRAILASDVPVATYVSPAGARADSAGTYILLASHIAAMAPTTHIGAATPVSMTGEDLTPSPADFGGESDEPDAEENDVDETDAPATAMERKVLNDAVAYIRTLAERHGRNADWAERAVTEAATLTADEALAENVIDYLVDSEAALFEAINGTTVETASGEIVISTANPVVNDYEAGWRLKLLMVISRPEILLLLGLVGIYGLILEGWNPGALVPGTVGAICLLLALYGSQTIPINYAGVALVLLGIGLMVAEAFAPSFGILGIGGILAFAFGAILTFDSGVPGFGISLTFVIGIALLSALFLGWVTSYLLKLRNRGVVYGNESLVGAVGTAMNDFDEDGKVWLEGEAWSARTHAPVQKDDNIRVVAVDGLVVEVEPAPANGMERSNAT